MPPDILNNQITELGEVKSVKGSLLDIDRFLTEQIEENALSFWCKSGVKMAHYTYH